MEVDCCLEALSRDPETARPEIFKTDQGSQFTSDKFTGILEAGGVAISMDGRGQVYDNIFVERLWRSLKYKEVYLRELATVREVRLSIGDYFRFYNFERLHQALGYKTRSQFYAGTRTPGPEPDPKNPVSRCTFPPQKSAFFVLTQGSTSQTTAIRQKNSTGRSAGLARPIRKYINHDFYCCDS
jgi:hypothetical protein